jgi:hypothetical protein
MHNAYLAGLIDGEGSIMLLKQGPRRSRRPQIAVAITELNVLEAVKAQYGGFIHTPHGHVPTWQLNGMPALEVLRAIQPYLVMERRKQLARLLTENVIVNRTDMVGSAGSKIAHNEALFQQMRRINSQRQTSVPWLTKSNPSDADIAYCAGILDGEGYVTNRKIEVCSTDPELIGWLESRFEGNVYAVAARSERHRPLWRWVRSATGCTWAAGVAEHMLLARKAQELVQMQDFQRTPPPPKQYPGDREYLRLRSSGVRRTNAARECKIPLSRARTLDAEEGKY